MSSSILRPSPGVGKGLPFAAIPHALVSDARLKPLDVRLACILLRYCRSGCSCWPAVRTLAKDLGRCERSAQYALARLKAAGWFAERPDSNPTGRLIYATWRVRPAGGATAALSQGIPRRHAERSANFHKPPQTSGKFAPRPVAPEGTTGRTIAPPAPDRRIEPAVPLGELLGQWLDGPPQLRRIALARLGAT